MIVPLLVTAAIILGAVAYYMHFIAPKRNPVTRAENFLRLNQIDDAILEYRKALEKTPDNYLLHYKLGMLYFKQSRIDQGVLHFEQVMRLGMFTYEVEKVEVQRKLAQSYMERDEWEKAFQAWLDIIADMPTDIEALYQVAFISLGQELFDMSAKHFERLIKQNERSFEIYFGAGMACYMSNSINDSVVHFTNALKENPDSEITILCLAFALQGKHDYKNAAVYAEKIANGNYDESVVFVGKRLLAILMIQQRKYNDGFRLLEQLLDFTQKNDMNDEKLMILYDLGFAAYKSEKTEQAVDYWNQLYKIQRAYRDVQKLVMLLRRDIDADEKLRKETPDESIGDYFGEWLSSVFPDNLIWGICGLKSHVAIDMGNIIITARVGGQRQVAVSSARGDEGDGDQLLRFEELDIENFKIIANRMMAKLGYNVREIKDTYRESDGVDFFAVNTATGNDCLVWVRRWKKTRVGEIPLRNLAQAVNDIKAKEGVFATTTPLTPSGETALKRLSKVKVLYPEDLEKALNGLV